VKTNRPFLVTGAGGLLGSRIARLLAEKRFAVAGTFHKTHPQIDSVSWYQSELGNPDEIAPLLHKIDPSLVVHSAAFTAVDDAEDRHSEASRTNVDATRRIAEECASRGLTMVYISTDYVFDGSTPPYSEDAPSNPLGHYARTKWEGEVAVRELLPDDHVICRVSVVFGWPWETQRQNFVSWAIGELRRSKTIRVVTDQWNNPTLAENGAMCIAGLIEARAKGTYHCTGRECLSRYDFALKICEQFDLPKELVIPVKTSELIQKAPRPTKNCVSVAKIEHLLGRICFSTEEALAYMMDQEKSTHAKRKV